MSSSNHFTLPIRVSEAQNGKRQRDEPDGEPQAKRVRWASPQPSSSRHHVDLSDSHDDQSDNNDNNDEDVISVLIGDDEHEYIVSRETICNQSTFFRETVATDSCEYDEVIVVHLPEMRTREFETYLHWLDNGEVKAELWCGCTEEDMPEGRELLAWMDIYNIAEYLEDHRLRAYAMEFLIAEHASWSTIPGADFSHAIWEATSEDSKLRTFIVEWVFHRFAGFTKSAKFVEQAPMYPEEFQKEFAKLAVSKGLLPNGVVPDEKSDLAFQDDMRAKLLVSD